MGFFCDLVVNELETKLSKDCRSGDIVLYAFSGGYTVVLVFSLRLMITLQLLNVIFLAISYCLLCLIIFSTIFLYFSILRDFSMSWMIEESLVMS
jgi:hypothetical protein